MNAPVAGLLGDSPWVRARAAELNQRFAGADTHRILRSAIQDIYPGRIALVSSFGAESAVLLHQVAAIDPGTPVVFLETGQLFAQTLQYADELTRHLGLTNVRTHRPDPSIIRREDPDGDLWRSDPDRCCHLRKVAPLAAALNGFDAWISGRKRYQGASRADLPLAEADGQRLKLNPLANWSSEDIDTYFAIHGLPRHPLHEFGFHSIGCHPCSAPTAPDDDRRAGRWAGRDKTECGIHRLRPPRRRSLTSSASR